jgi:hypothetical protein
LYSNSDIFSTSCKLPDSNLELKNIVVSFMFADGNIIGFLARFYGFYWSNFSANCKSRTSFIFLSYIEWCLGLIFSWSYLNKYLGSSSISNALPTLA